MISSSNNIVSASAEDLVKEHLSAFDLKPGAPVDISNMFAVGSKIKEVYAAMLWALARGIGQSTQVVATETPCSRNIDGGTSDSVYLPSQRYDGGDSLGNTVEYI